MKRWRIVEWKAWDGFLMRHALPEGQREPVWPGLALCGADGAH